MPLGKALAAVGRQLRRLVQRPHTPAAPGGDDDGLGELEPLDWHHHTAELLKTGFWAMARRLPRFVGQAVVLAWRASRVDTTLAIGLTVTSGVLTAFGLLATQQVLQALFTAGPTDERVYAAIPALVTVAAATAIKAGLGIAAGHAQARLAPQVDRRVELDLFAVTTEVELAAYDDTGFADELDRARTRGIQAPRWLVDHAVNLLTGLAGVLAVGATLAVIHPLLLPVLLAASLPNGWAAIRAARIEYASMYARVTRHRRIWILAELMARRHTAAELRSNGLRDFLLREYDRTTRADTRAGLEVINRQTGTRLLGGALSGTATAGVYVVLGLLVTAGWVPLAAAGTAALALQSGRTALDLAIRNVNGLYEEGLYHTDLVTFTTRAATRTVPPRRVSAVAAPRQITLTGVGFRYPDAETPALRDVSLTIRRGETIALVGENGSGKSTLAKLLAALYQPTEGTITWDGTDLADVDPGAVRDHVAVIAQDFWHWPFTARRNITIGRPTAVTDPATVTDAARTADAHDMITKLPRGYDTLLDRTFSGGHDLSGGQWQRLTSARGFYRDAAILICDEPSANLDARAEHTLFQHLHNPASDRITILITHRLANVRHADHIYVLHDGTLTEHGTHTTLTTTGGRYHQLFTLQAAGYLGNDQR